MDEVRDLRLPCLALVRQYVGVCRKLIGPCIVDRSNTAEDRAVVWCTTAAKGTNRGL